MANTEEELRAALAAMTLERNAAQRQLQECMAQDNGKALAEAAMRAASAIAEREALAAERDAALAKLDEAHAVSGEVYDRFIRALAIREAAFDKLDQDPPDPAGALRLIGSMDTERDLFALRAKLGRV